MQVNDLFYPNYYTKSKITVNQGGTWSGKTYTILQVLNQLSCEWKQTTTVVGQDIPNLKKGAIRDMQKICENPEVAMYLKGGSWQKAFNNTDRILTYKNGSIIEFSSFDSVQDAHSGKRDNLFINEAPGISFDIFWQLYIRTEHRVYIDYNPSARFWVHDKILPRKDCRLIISDHRRNKFISEEMHREIEAIDDPELFKVYARGLTGKIKGLIYPNHLLCDAIHPGADITLGLDFGFNHAMALTETGKYANNLYWNELIYQTELTIGDLIQLMNALGVDKSLRIYADSARPDAIEDLKRAGYNCRMANKDVKNGIDYVKRHQLFITRKSSNLIKEIGRYKWKEKDGITLEEPVKFMDDGMDSGRYGSYSHRKSNGLVSANVSETMTDNVNWINEQDYLSLI